MIGGAGIRFLNKFNKPEDVEVPNFFSGFLLESRGAGKYVLPHLYTGVLFCFPLKEKIKKQ